MSNKKRSAGEALLVDAIPSSASPFDAERIGKTPDLLATLAAATSAENPERAVPGDKDGQQITMASFWDWAKLPANQIDLGTIVNKVFFDWNASIFDTFVPEFTKKTIYDINTIEIGLQMLEASSRKTGFRSIHSSVDSTREFAVYGGLGFRVDYAYLNTPDGPPTFRMLIDALYTNMMIYFMDSAWRQFFAVASKYNTPDDMWKGLVLPQTIHDTLEYLQPLFGCLNKKSQAIKYLLDTRRKIFTRRSKVAGKLYCTVSDVEYITHADNSSLLYNKVGPVSRTNLYDVKQNNTFVDDIEIVTMPLLGDSLHENAYRDPFKSKVALGSFFRFINAWSDVDPRDYETHMSKIAAPSWTTNDFDEYVLAECIRHCPEFHPETGEINDRLFVDFVTINRFDEFGTKAKQVFDNLQLDWTDKNFHDIHQFLLFGNDARTKGGYVAKAVGEISERFASNEHLSKIAETLKCRIFDGLDSGEKEKFAAGLALMDDYDKESMLMTEADMKDINEFGLPDFYTKNKLGVAVRQSKRKGLGSVSGFLGLIAHATTFVDDNIIKPFIAVLKKITLRVIAITKGHVALSPSVMSIFGTAQMNTLNRHMITLFHTVIRPDMKPYVFVSSSSSGDEFHNPDEKDKALKDANFIAAYAILNSTSKYTGDLSSFYNNYAKTGYNSEKNLKPVSIEASLSSDVLNYNVLKNLGDYKKELIALFSPVKPDVGTYKQWFMTVANAMEKSTRPTGRTRPIVDAFIANPVLLYTLSILPSDEYLKIVGLDDNKYESFKKWYVNKSGFAIDDMKDFYTMIAYINANPRVDMDIGGGTSKFTADDIGNIAGIKFAASGIDVDAFFEVKPSLGDETTLRDNLRVLYNDYIARINPSNTYILTQLFVPRKYEPHDDAQLGSSADAVFGKTVFGMVRTNTSAIKQIDAEKRTIRKFTVLRNQFKEAHPLLLQHLAYDLDANETLKSRWIGTEDMSLEDQISHRLLYLTSISIGAMREFAKNNIPLPISCLILRLWETQYMYSQVLTTNERIGKFYHNGFDQLIGFDQNTQEFKVQAFGRHKPVIYDRYGFVVLEDTRGGQPLGGKGNAFINEGIEYGTGEWQDMVIGLVGNGEACGNNSNIAVLQSLNASHNRDHRKHIDARNRFHRADLNRYYNGGEYDELLDEQMYENAIMTNFLFRFKSNALMDDDPENNSAQNVSSLKLLNNIASECTTLVYSKTAVNKKEVIASHHRWGVEGAKLKNIESSLCGPPVESALTLKKRKL